ncbi:hypothetical protein [Halalkalibacillus halophilus]|uniref:hypothetical protein n=1 Tax=Halalkalibacillus halophilus TaxID=392827 RepID=UPI0003F5C094|nr:hypothetical protein [Halalkalibacillus halophilus]
MKRMNLIVIITALAIIGLMSALLGSTGFLFSLLIVGVGACIPLVIKAFTSGSVPRPTIYGTSAPGKLTTVGSNQASKPESKQTSTFNPFLLAAIGFAMLGMFFIVALFMY